MNPGRFGPIGCFGPLPVSISDYRMSSVIRLRTFPSKTTLGRTHGAPYRGYGYVPLRFGGGTSLGEWEHNNNNIKNSP